MINTREEVRDINDIAEDWKIAARRVENDKQMFVWKYCGALDDINERKLFLSMTAIQDSDKPSISVVTGRHPDTRELCLFARAMPRKRRG